MTDRQLPEQPPCVDTGPPRFGWPETRNEFAVIDANGLIRSRWSTLDWAKADAENIAKNSGIACRVAKSQIVFAEWMT